MKVQVKKVSVSYAISALSEQIKRKNNTIEELELYAKVQENNVNTLMFQMDAYRDRVRNNSGKEFVNLKGAVEY